MEFQKKKLSALFIPTFLVVVMDQISKHWVRLTPSLHDFDVIKGILAFHYTQNPGMALGMRWADTHIISIIAIIATILILVYIISSLPKANKSYLVCMGLILGGALGNIIDRLFMARIGEYGTFLEGHVIDFIHFNMRINDFALFPYIFNVADMAISVSLITLLVFHNRLLPDRDFGMEDSDGDIEREERQQNREQKREDVGQEEERAEGEGMTRKHEDSSKSGRQAQDTTKDFGTSHNHQRSAEKKGSGSELSQSQDDETGSEDTGGKEPMK